MKKLVFFLIFLSIRIFSFSQENNLNIDKLLIDKLVTEGELTSSNQNAKSKEGIYKNYLFVDSVNHSLSIIEFGITSVHGRHFFCYVNDKDTSFTESYDIKANLAAVSSYIGQSKMSMDTHLLIMEKLIDKIKFELNRYRRRGNLPY